MDLPKNMTTIGDAPKGSFKTPMDGGSTGDEPSAPTALEHIYTIDEAHPLTLDSGRTLAPVTIAYQTLGTLNQDKSNAILVCHALTGDHILAGQNPVTKRPGWWETMVGPGKTLDTNRYFVICSNVLGGCMGTTGPKDTDPSTGKPFGLDFPVITIADMVRAQKRLVDGLGI